MEQFDAKKVKEQVVKWIQDWFEENGRGCNAVIGISGGKDSSVVAGLCVEALGRDRVIGVTCPMACRKTFPTACGSSTISASDTAMSISGILAAHSWRP